MPIADPALPGEEGVAEATEPIKSGKPDHPIGSPLSNPGAGNPLEANARTLNRSPICSGSSKRLRPLWSRACCSGEARAHSAARRASAPNTRRKRPCGTGPYISTPVTLGGLGERGKVDIGAEIGAARACQRIGWAVTRDATQTPSDVARRAAVIDEQCGPRVAAQPRPEGRRQVQCGGANLEHRARRGGLAQNSRYKERQRWIFRTVGKDKPIFPVESNHPLGPFVRPAHS